MNSTTIDIRTYKARQVQIRSLTRGDRDRLADEFSHLSEQTRRRRFGGLATRLSERDLDRLIDIDHHDHEAVAATEPGSGRIVGVARYIAVPDAPGAAEVAVEVDDAWQGCGIGGRLISELAGRARAAGFMRLLAYVSKDNLFVLNWINRAGAIVEADDGDAALYGISLGPAETGQNAA
jgi:GNAT superfamily N-acetyltransferase